MMVMVEIQSLRPGRPLGAGMGGLSVLGLQSVGLLMLMMTTMVTERLAQKLCRGFARRAERGLQPERGAAGGMSRSCC
jgi:hypothetical protein